MDFSPLMLQFRRTAKSLPETACVICFYASINGRSVPPRPHTIGFVSVTLFWKMQEGKGPSVSEERITDTLMDMAVYCLIARILYEEGKPAAAK